MATGILRFFKRGGVFLFDEDDARSERSFYALEDLMGEEEGADIVETYVGADEEMTLYYDSSVLSEEEAVERFEEGQYSTTL